MQVPAPVRLFRVLAMEIARRARSNDFGRVATTLASVVAVASLGLAAPQASQSGQGMGIDAEAGTAAHPERLPALREVLERDLDYVPGEVLVKFRPDADRAAQTAIMSLARARGGQPQARWIGDVAVVSVDLDEPVATVASRLAMEPEVEFAQPNFVTRLSSTPNDPGLGQQWNLSAIEVPPAWDLNPGGADVLVAVVDSGVTTATMNVSYRLWTGRNFSIATIPYRVNPDLDTARISGFRDTTSTRLVITGQATQPVFDTQGHGTHVAGTILQSTNNAVGFAGIAYQARLLSVKSCFSYWDFQLYGSALGQPGFADPRVYGNGGCITSDVVEGIRWAADNGAKVINLSIGGPGPSPAYLDALNYAVQRGAFVSIAMGNDYERGNPTEYPASYAARVDGAMAVGSVGRSLRRAYYSNTGTHNEIAAPGGDPRDGGLAGEIHQMGLFDLDFDPFTVVVPRFDRYADHPSSGTSMAAPHVAGVAALLYSQGVTDPAAIEAAIKRFARDLGRSGPDPEYGYGLIDARATLRGLGLAR